MFEYIFAYIENHIGHYNSCCIKFRKLEKRKSLGLVLLDIFFLFIIIEKSLSFFFNNSLLFKFKHALYWVSFIWEMSLFSSFLKSNFTRYKILDWHSYHWKHWNHSPVTRFVKKYSQMSVNYREGANGKPKPPWWANELCRDYSQEYRWEVIYWSRNDAKTADRQKPRQAWVTGHQSWDPGTHCTTCRQFNRWENCLPGNSANLHIFQEVCADSVSSRCLLCFCLL